MQKELVEDKVLQFLIYSGIDWKIRADFERANRRTVRRAARYQRTSLRDC